MTLRRQPLLAATTVFIDVDTQVDFIEPHGSLYVPGAETLKPAFVRLLAAAGELGAAVIASADAHLPDDPEFDAFPPHCVRGTPGQRRVRETEPRSAHVVGVDGVEASPARAGATIVLEKVKFDLFTNPGADRLLAATGAETAVVFGVALEYCVLAAALGLRERGLRTVLVRDATAPVTLEAGATAEAELRRAGVLFSTTREVVEALTR